MADYKVLVPFILKCETGEVMRKGEGLENYFARARKKGFVNDPIDNGGATCCGITYKTFTTYRQRAGKPVPTVNELMHISLHEWLMVYKSLYWDKWQADAIKSQGIANLLVDFVWASGVYGIKNPQKVLGVTVDGIVGAQTIQALNSKPQELLFARLKACRVQYINNLCEKSLNAYQRKIGRKAIDAEKYKYTQYKFKKGWLSRINAINFKTLD